jgi:hypothetical protein
MNMPSPPAEGDFCDDRGNAIKPAIVEIAAGTWAVWTRGTGWQTFHQPQNTEMDKICFSTSSISRF